MELEIKEKQPKNIILEEFRKKYNDDELTIDGIPNIEVQLKEIKLKDEEQLSKYNEEDKKRYKREMTQRVKCLALNKMGKDIMYNTTFLNIKDRKKLQEIMYSYNDVEPEKIIEEFNALACDVLDDIKSIDYSKLPIYEI